jgi:predicted transcriptional regulator
MTTPCKILVELLDTPSTTDAIAERVRVPMLVAEAMLQRHEKEGYVSRRVETLTVWSLTVSGKTFAKSLQPACTP